MTSYSIKQFNKMANVGFKMDITLREMQYV